MGIRFSDSILSLLATAAFAVSSLFFGHAISEMTAWAWLTAIGMVAFAAAAGALAIHRIRTYARQRDA